VRVGVRLHDCAAEGPSDDDRGIEALAHRVDVPRPQPGVLVHRARGDLGLVERGLRGAVATQIRRDDPKPLREDRICELMLPVPGGAGEPMDEDERLRGGVAGLDDVERDAVGRGDGALARAGHPVSLPQRE
jgi:hypothetical protein